VALVKNDKLMQFWKTLMPKITTDSAEFLPNLHQEITPLSHNTEVKHINYKSIYIRLRLPYSH
jgi:lipopolysaccharide biosynthesis glycosyltransferase